MPCQLCRIDIMALDGLRIFFAGVIWMCLWYRFEIIIYLRGGGIDLAFEAVIGLEIHAQLLTVSKLFCSCPNISGQTPNKNICEAVLEPKINVFIKEDKLFCSLENSIPGTEIYYSVDNTYPVHFSKKYTEPFIIPEGELHLITRVYRKGEPIGRIIRLHRNELEKRASK